MATVVLVATAGAGLWAYRAVQGVVGLADSRLTIADNPRHKEPHTSGEVPSTCGSSDEANAPVFEFPEAGWSDAEGEWAAAQAEARPAGTGEPAPPEQVQPPARQPLRRYNGKHVDLWTDAKAEYAGDLLLRLDDFLRQAHAEMARLLETPAKLKAVQIYVFEHQERYQEYAREHAPGLVNNGGFYDGGVRTVVTYRYNNSMQLYFHELVHAMMGEQLDDHHFSRYTRRNWPVWFDEGISEYLGSFVLHDGKVRIPAQNKGKLAYLVNALANRMFIDLPSLLRAPADRFSGASMNIYYAEAWGLLDFLISQPATRGQVAPFYRRIKAGEDGVAAFKASFGDDLGALDAAWRAYIYQTARTEGGDVVLFHGDTIDDWTIHEGGHWRAAGGEVSGTGERNYNYLIKSELPVSHFDYDVELQLQRGTAGLVLGNNYHGEYPYHYLIEIGRDVVMVRRAWTASQIEPIIQAYAEVPEEGWVRVRASVRDRVLRLSVGDREVLQTRIDRDRFSLFGLYLYRAKVKFRNMVLHRDPPGGGVAHEPVSPLDTTPPAGPVGP